MFSLHTLPLVAALLASAHGFYANTPVVELTAADFDQVYADTMPWMLEFYAPWCGHCQRLTPEYIKAAKNTDGLARMGAVNCDDQVNQAVCGPFGVRGFPTIKLMPPGGKRASDAVDYNGARQGGAMAKALLAQLGNHVSKIAAGDKHDKWAASELGKVLLFSEKPAVTTLYKALAQQFQNRLAFAQAPIADAELKAKYGVEKAPTLLVLPAGSDEPVLYDGPLKPVKLGKFLAQHAPELKRAGGKAGGKASGGASDAPAPPKTPAQDALWRIASADDYKARCQERPGTCIIALLDPLGDNFAEHRKELESVLDEHKGGAFTFVWTNAFDQEAFVKAIGMQGQDLPQLVAINDGKGAWNRYVGAFAAEKIGKYLGKLKIGAQAVQKLPDNADIVNSFIKEKLNEKDEL